MTEQQFKILCRAYWPSCRFVAGHCSTWCDFGDPITRVVLYKGSVFGLHSDGFFVPTNGETNEEVIREIYNDRTAV